ncbi:hypothetical protein [Sphingobacterium bambusae]|uniref:XRE family transcriptional regulator n=1 Tax=Sphingobacterium bambusae TaxID=662858 RepID=A0ABW6BCX6_9SPHI|nr:hypothetical protein [Sphingobacterium bambusae]WPL48610.1 hypothetical protein SCB77_21920 [Sphingobacterium bambusae]
MENLDLQNITQNILLLLRHVGIKDMEFAAILEISEKQFRLIKEGKASFNIKQINLACDFFVQSIKSLNAAKIKIEDDYRRKLALKHKHKNQYYVLLNKRPSLRHAIEFGLLSHEKFVKEGMATNEVQFFFMNKGWKFTSSSISTALIRNNTLVTVIDTKVVDGKKVNIYGPNNIPFSK